MSTFKGLLQGFTKVDSRPLSHMDIEYFDNAFAPLNCAVVFESNFFGNDKKLRQAFVRAVETSPILCSVVEGEGKGARFVPITSPEDWPALTIEHLPVDAQGEVMTRVRTVMADQIESLQKGGKDEHRKSVRFTILKSGKKIAFVLITPHHFLDGVGIASFLAKYMMLAILPKISWGIIIQKKCPKVLPPFMEMPFKKDYPAVQDRLIPNTEMRPPYNHFFPNHDFADPESPGKLKGIDGMLTISSKQVVKQVRAALREEGISISIAFSALAVKLLAVILKNHNANPESKQVTSSTGTDIRQFSQWGDERDRKQGRQLPVEGNFTCKQNYSFEFEEALEQPLVAMAHVIKKDMARLHTDTEYRMDRVLNQWNEPVMAYAGVSSVLAPNVTGAFLFRNMTLESTIDFGPVPRVWFYVLTAEGQTCLKADIALPLPGLTEAELRREMSLIVKDSPLKALFSGVLE
ncbi:MAG: hypothetical protein AB8F95_01070 [Bacteroidia bacterium]